MLPRAVVHCFAFVAKSYPALNVDHLPGVPCMAALLRSSRLKVGRKAACIANAVSDRLLNSRLERNNRNFPED